MPYDSVSLTIPSNVAARAERGDPGAVVAQVPAGCSLTNNPHHALIAWTTVGRSPVGVVFARNDSLAVVANHSTPEPRGGRHGRSVGPAAVLTRPYTSRPLSSRTDHHARRSPTVSHELRDRDRGGRQHRRPSDVSPRHMNPCDPVGKCRYAGRSPAASTVERQAWRTGRRSGVISVGVSELGGHRPASSLSVVTRIKDASILSHAEIWSCVKPLLLSAQVSVGVVLDAAAIRAGLTCPHRGSPLGVVQ
jgi:hypothetical protein